MTGHWVFAHLTGLAHGLAAALISVAAFYVVGLLLLPRRWQSSIRWPDSIVLGLTSYVLLCWVATSSRNIPIVYVMLVFGAALWGLAAVRFRWLQATLGPPYDHRDYGSGLSGSPLLYVFAYLLSALQPAPQSSPFHAMAPSISSRTRATRSTC